MRVTIAFGIAQILHQPGGRVAQVERHRFLARVLDVVLRRRVGRVHRIRLGREAEIDHRLGQRQITLGRAEKIDGLLGREAQVQRFRRGQADVFDSHADDTAGEIKRVFAGGEHARQPVQSRVGIAVADAFVQRRDQVVVLFAGLVIHQHALLHGLGRDRFVDVLCALIGQLRCNLERVVRRAAIAARVAGDQVERFVVRGQLHCAQAAFLVVQGTAQQQR